MTNDDTSRIDIGSCSSCGRTLRVKPRGLRQNLRLTCKCGHVNTVTIDQATLIQHGVIKPTIIEDIYQIGRTPLYCLLDGPRLRARLADVTAEHEERWKDLPRELRSPPSDIISVSMNPYLSEQNARAAMRVLVDRVRSTDKARPWSVELYKNVDCAIRGLLGAPFFIFLGMTEIKGHTSDETYNTFKGIVADLRSDDRRAQSGGEWEIWSQYHGNEWRGDRCAKLLERWVFLDNDAIQTFGIPPD